MDEKALVRPLLEYASSVWDPIPSNTTAINTIEKIQRRAARWTMQDYRITSDVDDMLAELNWPLLATRRQTARLTNLYKFRKGLLKIETKHPPTAGKQKKSGRTTNSQAYDTSQPGKDYRKQTFFPHTIPEWNKLPENVVSTPTLTTFTSRLHRHFRLRLDLTEEDPVAAAENSL